MLIGVISDSHGEIEKIKKVLGIFEKMGVKMIIHAGDLDRAGHLELFKELALPIKMVIGNIDEEPERYLEKSKSLGLDFEMNTFLNIKVDNCRIFVFHGNVLGPLELVLDKFIDSKLYDVVVYGHTHKKRNENKNGVLLLNPGSLQPIGLGIKESVAVYDTDTNKAEIINL